MRIRSVATIKPYAVEEIYVVSEQTMSSDRQRKCWICGGDFNYQDQADEEAE